MQCPNCGANNIDYVQQCAICGAMMPVQVQPVQVVVTNSKSKIAAGLLAIFLGTLGIHNFYLGHTMKGLLQLGLSVVGWVLAICTLGISLALPGLVELWALVEGILLLVGAVKTDAKGVPLQ